MPSDRLRRLALIVWTAVGVAALLWVFLLVADAVRVIWLPIAFAAGLVFLLEPDGPGLRADATPEGGRRDPVLPRACSLGLSPWRPWSFPRSGNRPPTSERSFPIYTWPGSIGSARSAPISASTSTSCSARRRSRNGSNDPANQETVQNLLLGFGAGAGLVIRGVTEAIAVLALAPVLAIYILIDLERFKSNSLGMTPPRHREETAFVAGEVGTAMGSFVVVSSWCR